MGHTLLSESHGSSLELTKTVNVEQGRPIVHRQALSFETSLRAVGCSQVVNGRIHNCLVEESVACRRNESPETPSRSCFIIAPFPDTDLEELISMGDGDWES